MLGSMYQRLYSNMSLYDPEAASRYATVAYVMGQHPSAVNPSIPLSTKNTPEIVMY